MRESTASRRDRAAAARAADQDGVLHRGDLIGAGLDDDAIGRRVAAGRLHRRARGVYTLAPGALCPRAHRRIALLACGAQAVLSHGSAGTLEDVCPEPTTVYEITAPRRRGRSERNIRCYGARLLPAERAVRDGFAVTSPARTLLDLAATRDAAALDRALERAIVVGCFDRRAVEGLLVLRAGGRRAATLRAALERLDPDGHRTKQELEPHMLTLLRSSPLSGWEVNAWLPGIGAVGVEADLLWRDARLVVELDSRRHHAGHVAFERDRTRDAELLVAGYRVLRFTWRQVTERPDWVIATISAVLGSARAA